MARLMNARLKFLLSCLLLSVVAGAAEPAREPAARVRSLKITVLSTMLADGNELGEWGFAALVEVDGHRLLFDTGAHTDVVWRNAQTLGLDLATVPDVVLSHNHSDHVGGFLALREAVQPKAATALARTHVAEGIFYPRFSLRPDLEDNPMVRLKTAYEKTGGAFVVHRQPARLLPGVWLTGPVPRTHPERNWSGVGRVRTPDGVVEDTVPEDQALVFDTEQGLVVLAGCAHAGVINTLGYARTFIRPARIHALIGGIHLFSASDETLNWTEGKLAEFGLENFIGAHCTGIEPVYRFRHALNLNRTHAVVGAVGTVFELGRGIDPRHIAK